VFWSESDALLTLFGTLPLAQQRARIEREAAHLLKSAAQTFGYQRLAVQLERNAAALDDAACRKLLDAMAKAYAAARDEDA
jgi:hypothetical protein